MDLDYTKVRPLHDHILLKRVQAENKIGSIIIPDAAKEKPAEGVVMAVGPGRIHNETGRRVEPSVRVGDRVLFGKYSGNQIAGLQAREVEYMMVREDEILAVVEP